MGDSSSTSLDEEATALARLLLAHFSRYPEAADTLEGISQWWLPGLRARIRLEALERALAWLTENNVLEQAGTQDRPVYQLKKGATRQPVM